MKEKYLNVQQIAEDLGLSESTIYHWCAGNRIPHYKIGGCLRFKKSKVDKYIRKKKFKSPNPKLTE